MLNLGSKKEKTDKGFQLLYFKLSYRRKFIRSLWIIPFGIILTIFLITNTEIDFINHLIQKIIIPILFVILTVWQLNYNYTKWKKQEKENKII